MKVTGGKKHPPMLKSLSEERKSVSSNHRGRVGLGKGFFLGGREAYMYLTAVADVTHNSPHGSA